MRVAVCKATHLPIDLQVGMKAFTLNDPARVAAESIPGLMKLLADVTERLELPEEYKKDLRWLLVHIANIKRYCQSICYLLS